MTVLVVETISTELRYLKQMEYLEKVEQVINEYLFDENYIFLIAELKENFLYLYQNDLDINDSSNEYVQRVQQKVGQLFIFTVLNYEYFTDLPQVKQTLLQ